MSNKDMQDLSGIEEEFNEEVKGYGSLTLSFGSGEDSEKLGYNIRPEDIEALYFEGIGTKRWESFEEEDVDERSKMYHASMNEIMSKYPLFGRVKDTDLTVEFSTEEVSQLTVECEKVLESTTSEKAIRSVQKFQIACNKATAKNSGLVLNPC